MVLYLSISCHFAASDPIDFNYLEVCDLDIYQNRRKKVKQQVWTTQG